jgi:hypothetical protein
MKKPLFSVVASNDDLDQAVTSLRTQPGLLLTTAAINMSLLREKLVKAFAPRSLSITITRRQGQIREDTVGPIVAFEGTHEYQNHT